MKRLIFLLALMLSASSFAQDRVSATWNASITKRVAYALINGESYSNVLVELKSSSQGYTSTYTSGILAGSSTTVDPWVKIKIYDSATKKKILSKKLDKSCIFIFDSGQLIQIGQPDNATLEAVLRYRNGVWRMEFDEYGDIH